MPRMPIGSLFIMSLCTGLASGSLPDPAAASSRPQTLQPAAAQHEGNFDHTASLETMLKWMETKRDRLDAELRARQLRENPPAPRPPGVWVCGTVMQSPYTRQLLTDAQWNSLLARTSQALHSDDLARTATGFDSFWRIETALCALYTPVAGTGLQSRCSPDLLPRAVLDDLLAGVLHQAKSKDPNTMLMAIAALGREMWPRDSIERRTTSLLEATAIESCRPPVLGALQTIAMSVSYKDPQPFGRKTADVTNFVRESLTAVDDRDKNNTRMSSLRMNAFFLASRLGENSRELVPLLIEKARSNKKNESNVALHALSSMGPRAAEASPLFAEFANSPDLNTRTRAFALLESIGSPTAEQLTHLLNALDDLDKHIQSAAARCIIYLRPQGTPVAERIAQRIAERVAQDPQAFGGYGPVALETLRTGKLPDVFKRRWHE